MRLPGYTAEVALRSTTVTYNGTTDPLRGGTGQGVEPQFCRSFPGGITCTDCFEYGGQSYCWNHTIRIPTLF